ncbi:zinc ribbon domain-containing protein [Candidatus Pacearchaeota archaeon]|nr:zinc ribbon domain-containing protein [Candidatus Pacearchaeota archaeon]
MGSNIDLRRYEDPSSIQDAFSKVVSGKAGYKAVIERKKPKPKCTKCGRGGDEDQKFCPQCGGKMAVPMTNCPGCKKPINENDKFCIECGHQLKE